VAGDYGRVAGDFDQRVSAPETIGELMKDGAAQFVGLRAGRKGTPDMDLLILRAEAEAAAALAKLAREGVHARTQGSLVTIVALGAQVPVPAPARAAVNDCAREAGVA
jgi:hypothetical protein